MVFNKTLVVCPKYDFCMYDWIFVNKDIFALRIIEGGGASQNVMVHDKGGARVKQKATLYDNGGLGVNIVLFTILLRVGSFF